MRRIIFSVVFYSVIISMVFLIGRSEAVYTGQIETIVANQPIFAEQLRLANIDLEIQQTLVFDLTYLLKWGENSPIGFLSKVDYDNLIFSISRGWVPPPGIVTQIEAYEAKQAELISAQGNLTATERLIAAINKNISDDATNLALLESQLTFAESMKIVNEAIGVAADAELRRLSILYEAADTCEKQNSLMRLMEAQVDIMVASFSYGETLADAINRA